MLEETGFLFFFFFPFYLSIHCAGSSLLHMGFSLVGAGGGSSSLWCMAFSLQWLLLLPSSGYRHAASIVAAQLLLGMWYLPRPEIKPVSPALATMDAPCLTS